MATQRLGEKKLKRLRATTGLDIKIALVRGGWDLSVKLLLADFSVAWIDKHGIVTFTDERWRLETKEEAEARKLS